MAFEKIKPLLFFIIVLAILLYVIIFWQNRHEKTEFTFFSGKSKMNLGLLMLVTFVDGVILALLLTWLL